MRIFTANHAEPSTLMTGLSINAKSLAVTVMARECTAPPNAEPVMERGFPVNESFLKWWASIDPSNYPHARDLCEAAWDAAISYMFQPDEEAATHEFGESDFDIDPDMGAK